MKLGLCAQGVYTGCQRCSVVRHEQLVFKASCRYRTCAYEECTEAQGRACAVDYMDYQRSKSTWVYLSIAFQQLCLSQGCSVLHLPSKSAQCSTQQGQRGNGTAVQPLRRSTAPILWQL